MGFSLNNPDLAAAGIKAMAAQLVPGMMADVQVRVRAQGGFLVSVLFRENNLEAAGFTLIEQPNCNGVLVSIKTFVNGNWQKQGMAQAMMPLKVSIARQYGYSALTATVNETGNPAEVHILAKTGWKKGWSVKNRRTGNDVGFWFLPINPI